MITHWHDRAVFRRDGNGSGNGGFTLMEMLIAIALMGIVLSALTTITAQWIPNWHRGFARVQRNEMLDVTLSRLVSDVGAAEFVTANRKATKPLFEGGELSVTFVRSALGPNTRPSLEVVRIAPTADRAGSLLVRSRAPFAPTDPDAPQSLPAVFADQVALLRAPYLVSFAYADRDGLWHDRWVNEDDMPASVRFTIRDAVTKRSLAISTAAVVRVDTPVDCVQQKSKRDCGTSAGDDRNKGQPGAAKQQTPGGG
jgi:general secretion pathway protein J